LVFIDTAGLVLSFQGFFKRRGLGVLGKECGTSCRKRVIVTLLLLNI